MVLFDLPISVVCLNHLLGLNGPVNFSACVPSLWLHYLNQSNFSIVNRKLMHLQEDAHSVLQEACQAFPWNWSAWLDLAEICVSGGDSTSGNSKSGSSASAVPEGFNGQMNSGNAGSGSGDADSVNASDSSSSQGGGGGAAPEDACLQVALQGPAPWTRKVFLAHALVRRTNERGMTMIAFTIWFKTRQYPEAKSSSSIDLCVLFVCTFRLHAVSSNQYCMPFLQIMPYLAAVGGARRCCGLRGCPQRARSVTCALSSQHLPARASRPGALCAAELRGSRTVV